MSNDGVQFDNVQNVQVVQAAGDFHGDAVARDKNVYHIQSLTIYLASRPQEPELKPISAGIGPNPYKGLSAFQETDADRFFGREQLTQLLYEKFLALHEVSLLTLSSSQEIPTPDPSQEGSLGTNSSPEIPLPGGVRGGFSLEGKFPLPGGVRGGLRLLAVLGPSGSGKSSVARAGLLPELARRPLPGKQKALVAVFTPGMRPLESLATILARIAANDPAPVAKSREFALGELQESHIGKNELSALILSYIRFLSLYGIPVVLCLTISVVIFAQTPFNTEKLLTEQKDELSYFRMTSIKFVTR